MQDLTQGSIPRHIIKLATPIMAGMLFQTLYLLIDLYFVARLGDAAIAGVSAAGTIAFIVMALTQVLGVGTVTLIAQAVGRKDHDDANLVFNQSMLIAALCAVVTLVGGYMSADAYMHWLGADAATEAAGREYLYWYMPGLALQFALVSTGSALRGTGIAKPTMLVQMLTVLLNAILAPIFIAGWGTGNAMGVAGAGLASSVSIAAGVLLMFIYFTRLEKFVHFNMAMFRPRLETWRRILVIGLPAGGEFGLLFVYMAVIYSLIRDFGPAAQAGFGVGSRVMQSIFLPGMAVAFAISPVAGQNVGARLHDRVRQTFRSALVIECGIMFALTLICQVQPAWFVHWFTKDPAVVAVAAEFLRYISWNFLAQGIIFSCSGLFQALGNTVPSMLSSATRILTFVAPSVWLSTQPNFELHHLWIVSVVSVACQAVVSLVLLRWQFKQRLTPTTAAIPA